MKVLWFAVSILGALSYDRYADGNDDHYDVKDDHFDRNVDHYDATDDHYDGPYVDRSDWYHVEYEERQVCFCTNRLKFLIQSRESSPGL